MLNLKNINNKLAIEGLDYLISNGIKPLSYSNDREYNSETGELIKEAENIFIDVPEDQETNVTNLINTWINA